MSTDNTIKSEHFDYTSAPYQIRQDLPEAYRNIWQMLSEPGNWWSGQERIEIAQETRNARSCQLCADRKAALSPYAVTGRHDATTSLPEVVIDAIHRLTTDPSRLSKTWLQECADQGLSDAAYIEIVGIVVAVISIDTFHRALDMPDAALPTAQPGKPSHLRPAGLQDHGAWIPTIVPRDLAAEEKDLYGGVPRTGNVITAMSLVPDAVRMLIKLSDVQYLPMADIASMSRNGTRALSRPQIELVAARVSALSDCFY